MKQMKPCKAWGLVGKRDGRITFYGNFRADVYKTEAFTKKYHDPDTDRLLRVRVLDDAAVERVIDLLRGLECGSTADEDRVNAAIRDLGGKP